MIDEGTIEKLFSLYYRGEATAAQTELLMAALRGADPALLQRLIRQEGEALAEMAPVSTPDEAAAMLERIMTKQSRVRRMHWPRYAAAAAALVLITAGLFWLNGNRKTETAIAAISTDAGRVMPAGQKVMLFTEDSAGITLDSLQDGPVAGTAGAAVAHQNGHLVYGGAGKSGNAKITYNTIVTGKGNFYRLTLSDGTQVWLNASTSLRFPVYFPAGERQVSVTGEAYFEVAKDPARPFRVAVAGKGTVEVLGTHFNVNAYPEDPAIKTTLLEGAVKLSAGGRESRLSPGQQAVLENDGIRVRSLADPAQMVAWKDGNFWFDNTGLPEVMNQIARWYDVDVVFEGKPANEGYSGKLSRNVSLATVLKVLELNGVRCRLEGRKLTIFQ